MDEKQQEHHRQSDEWVKTSLIATVVTVVIGVIGFSIQINNLTRAYEQRQTTVEVKLQSLLEDMAEVKQNVK
ncbi:hypothetical protein [Synechocystis salina]|uniref:Uncharacterized protein n=1 Tax=Synechocystis salina LEGE 00031 TaxID=1828736 RepID=A0ABR9VMY3_9SYNC|nr:hypothetical protein [Synechocystis salina]MBE9239675.1 hypothetical protein [Synechocystis salina LEGE 00041]MBE9252714.1 hypothetical protein [Synechocystis salina LEGE 00031]